MSFKSKFKHNPSKVKTKLFNPNEIVHRILWTISISEGFFKSYKQIVCLELGRDSVTFLLLRIVLEILSDNLLCLLNKNPFQLYCNEAEKLETVLRPQLNLLGQDSFQSTSVPHILPHVLKYQQHQVNTIIIWIYLEIQIAFII